MSNYIERYWRDATPADAIREPPMVARFKNFRGDNWEFCSLVGWDRTDLYKWRGVVDQFEICQVYDAPDPGEGWRLVDVDKEQPQENDEFLVGKTWCFAKGYMREKLYPKNQAIRRRIEQPKPAPKYVPFE